MTDLDTVSFFNPVAHDLGQVEVRLRQAPRAQYEALTAAVNHLLDSGGKRVRPALALLAGSMLGADRKATVALAAAVEMLHTATLVHDDLIDGSLLRRGIPTLNARWSPAATVLTGDYIFARAADLAASTGSVRVMTVFARTLMTVVNGEVHQLFASPGNSGREDYERRIYAKTASMFELATEAAGVLAGVSERRIAAMATYGREVGMAFQIVDDILDFVGDQTHIGKPVGSDLRHGLVTLPALHYLESHPDDPDMQALLNGHARDSAQVDRVVAAIRASGAVTASLFEARQHVERGVGALADMPDNEHRRALSGLAEYIVRRDL